MSLLPTKKNNISIQDPKNLILFGLPKCGKTTAISMLKDALIIDLENGSDFVEAYAIKANSYIDLFNIAKELKTNTTYKFVVLDTITALEDIALPLANKLFRDTSMGKNWSPDENIMNLANGGGYYWARLAIKKIIEWFTQPHYKLIILGHVKDKALNEFNTELNVKTLDVAGKLGNILSADSDAICYVYRDLENGNLLCNFGDMNSVLCGSRIKRLSGRTITLIEKLEDGTFVDHWDEIFNSLNNE